MNNLKIFIDGLEIKDDELILNIIPIIGVRKDYESIPEKIKYIIKLESSNEDYLINYYTNNWLLPYSLRIEKKYISHVLRDFKINSLLND